MGSVIDYIECPNCGQEAYDDFYYKTGEEYINCQNCGYHKSATIISRDKALNELTDEDWEINELTNPYGAYRIQFKGDPGAHCGSLGAEDDLITMKEQLSKMDNVELFTVSRFIDGEIITETIIENKQDGESDTGI